MAKKAASGIGTIRKKTVVRMGKEYTYWEARYSAGRDLGTGKQVQRSITGKTQKEVAQKLKAATASIDAGTYVAPNKMTVGEWLDIWARDYLGGVKPATVAVYKNNIKLYIKPALGAVGLLTLRPHMVQEFVNGMDVSPSTILLAYRVLHQALEKAVKIEYILRNPSTDCELPRREPKQICPLSDERTSLLLKAINGDLFEILYKVALFTGLRQSELLGLTWDCVNAKCGTLLINKQLLLSVYRKEDEIFSSPKNGKVRTISPAPLVFKLLRQQRSRQAEKQLKAGALWDNVHNLVFTGEFGAPIEHWTLKRHFKDTVDAIGLQGVRFHDLRHTYAVNAIRAGDDIKTIQGNLGHASAAFTLDRYGHFTERMKADSAARMEDFARKFLGQ